MMEPISSFLVDIVNESSEIIENHYFSSYFGLYLEYKYAQEKYNPPDDIISKLLEFPSLSIEEKKKYGKIRKNIMSDPLLPKLNELISRHTQSKR
ncbi:MAG TPA: hypothetical protein PLS49_08120 [Candidatus Woesebacteria bacterium]|nr:hypothetical protein [Candidatus Woesebacteria bacterium]